MIYSNKKAFTLVEMITVMVIVGILLGLVLTGSFNAIKEARIEKAKASIKAAKAALDMFEADVGSYPVYIDTAGWQGNDFKPWLVDGTWWNGFWDVYDNWVGPYMNFIEADLDITDKNHYLDPWRKTYRYYCADGKNYQLWSCGPDGNNDSGAGDDINSWD